jgi:hypothetical protein
MVLGLPILTEEDVANSSESQFAEFALTENYVVRLLEPSQRGR